MNVSGLNYDLAEEVQYDRKSDRHSEMIMNVTL